MRSGWLAVACSLFWVSVAAAHGSATLELERLDARLARDPENVEVRLNRAELHRRRGDLGAALADLRVVEAKAPALRRMLLERALVRRALGNVAGARSDLDRVLSSGSPMVAALVARAELFEQSGEVERARADYDVAYSARPTPDLALLRGKLDERSGKLDRAAAGYEQALKDLGGALVVRLALVDVERRRNRHARAIELIDELVKQSPVKSDWLLLRADVHEDAGHAALARRDRSSALHEAERILRKRPTLLSRVTRAKAQLALGRRRAAVRELEQVLRRAPKLEEARQLLLQAQGPSKRGKSP